MNPFVLEEKRVKLLETFSFLNGPIKLSLLVSFLYEVLETKNKNVAESYILEFYDDYLDELKKISLSGLEPEFIQSILEQIKRISIVIPELNGLNDLLEIKKQLQYSLEYFISFLNGNAKLLNLGHNIFFPLIQTYSGDDQSIYLGSLQSLKVKITIAKSENSFIFLPTSFSIDRQLRKQVENSLSLALSQIRQFKKNVDNFFEVIIRFDNLHADYKGYSLGIALTVALIERLSFIYNLPYNIYIKNNVASTGGVEENGTILSVSDKVIKEKIRIAFYSYIDKIIIPKIDETAAEESLRLLLDKYPNRKLEIIAIKDFKEVIANRELIKIRKRAITTRAFHHLKNNWQLVLLIVLFSIFVSFIVWKNYDTNPYSIDWEGTHLKILNRNGQVLQNEPYNLDHDYFHSDSAIKLVCKIVDINSDGTNEIIYALEPRSILKNPEDYTRIVCMNNNNKIIWKHFFDASISSPLENLKSIYSQRLIDTATVNGRKILVAFATNGPSYSCAIFTLDLLTGKPIGDTLWHAGHICEGFLHDFNNDGIKELVFISANNGYERAALGIIGLNELKGQGPSTKKYMFYNKGIANFKFYALLPNTDLNKYLRQRNMSIYPGNLLDNPHDKNIIFNLFNSQNRNDGNLAYSIDYQFRNFDIIIGSDFRVVRDTLVAHHKLAKPFTDTKEYITLLKNQIMIWDKDRFDSYKNYQELSKSSIYLRTYIKTKLSF